MPNPIGARSIPEVIEQWTRFYGAFGSITSPTLAARRLLARTAISELMKDGFPHEGESYLSVKSRVETQAAVLRRRANELMSSVSAEVAE